MVDPNRARVIRATWALLLVTVLWGMTFSWMKEALDVGEASLGPRGSRAAIALMITVRFGISAPLLALLLPGARRLRDPAVWGWGSVIGVVLLAGFLLQLFGLEGVSPAVSAFLTSLYVLFVALLTARRDVRAGRLRGATVAGCLLATVGAGFISGPPQLHFGVAEWLTVACAFAFALHILVTDHATRRAPPLALTTVQLLVVAVGGAITLGLVMAAPGGPSGAEVRALVTDPDFLRPTLLCTFLATLVALTLINLYQREVTPVRAAILYALEPVWASVAAVAAGQTLVDGWLVFGGLSLLAGNLVVEVGPRLARAYGSRRPPPAL